MLQKVRAYRCCTHRFFSGAAFDNAARRRPGDAQQNSRVEDSLLDVARGVGRCDRLPVVVSGGVTGGVGHGRRRSVPTLRGRVTARVSRLRHISASRPYYISASRLRYISASR
ncbi:hypothetical protein GCM10023223_00230 [Stackebrandtia albiflava]